MDRISITKHFIKSNEYHLMNIFCNESNDGKQQGVMYINVTSVDDIKVYFIKKEQMDTSSPNYKTVIENNDENRCLFIGIDNNNEFILIEGYVEKNKVEYSDDYTEKKCINRDGDDILVQDLED